MSEAQLSKIEAERASLEEEVKKLEDAWTPEKAAEEIIAYVRSSGDKVGNGVLDPFQNPESNEWAKTQNENSCCIVM